LARRDRATEEDLIRRFRDGDGEALCALFDRHEALLRRRIERWLPRDVRRRLSVGDVLQEARIVALERHRDFQPTGADGFRNWILGIAEMRVRYANQRHRDVAKRSARREVTKPARAETAQFAGRGPTPSEVAIGAEAERIARRALAALPDDYREILRLTREEGLALREAAERLQRSYEATKKLYGRALTRLAAEFRRLEGTHHE